MATPTLAIWKLASCDGCQLTLLDCEDELLAVAGAVRIEHFLEASSATTRGSTEPSVASATPHASRVATMSPNV